MVTNGGGWGTVALTTPQQSGSTPFLIKYPDLQVIKEYSCGRWQLFPRVFCDVNLLFQLMIILTFTACLIYLYGIVSTICDQQRLSMQKCCCSDGCAVDMSLLSDQLPALQIPERNVALRAA